jgi:hypothetical protein
MINYKTMSDEQLIAIFQFTHSKPESITRHKKLIGELIHRDLGFYYYAYGRKWKDKHLKYFQLREIKRVNEFSGVNNLV